MIPGLVAGAASAAANAGIMSQHHFSWWSDPEAGIVVTGQGESAPSPGAVHLLDLDEWHLDDYGTERWYNGFLDEPELPSNPFNSRNRDGLLGSITPVTGGEAFIYRVSNYDYGSGNGDAAPFPFTNGFGLNDISGINIIDSGDALDITSPAAGSQFMFSYGETGQGILDLTPGTSGTSPTQDWSFNAFTGDGNFEWDIQPMHGIGGVSSGHSLVFGFAMPGNWFDQINDGWVHSWDQDPSQVNSAITGGGFSGPFVPAPGAAFVGGLGALSLSVRRRARVSV